LEFGRFLASLVNKMNDPDLIIINFQELIELKPNHSVAMGMLFQQDISQFKQWAKFMKGYFLAQYPDYICQNKRNLLGLGTFHFVHKRNLRHINHMFSTSIKFGFMNAMPNKGSIISSIHMYDSTLVFANAHLPSGQGDDKVKIRSNKVEEIMKTIQSNNRLQYDIFFLAGDLNLRCFGLWPFEVSTLTELEEVNQNDEDNQIGKYLGSDEVQSGKFGHTVLGNLLVEGKLPTFPTYKVKKGLGEATYVPERRPSWTDRVFYHHKNEEIDLRGTEVKFFYIPESDHM